MSALFTTVLPLVAALLFAPPSDPSKDSLLAKIVAERAGIRSGEVTIAVRFVAESADAKDGRRSTYHYWFTSDKKRFRLDRTEINDPDSGNNRHLDRFSYDGTTYRLIDEMDNNYAVREYTKDRPVVAPELFDPRLLGIFCQQMEILHNYTMNDVIRIASTSVNWKSRDSESGPVETFIAPNCWSRTYHYNRAGLPIRIECEGDDRGHPPRLRFEAQIEYDPPQDRPSRFPSQIDFKRYEAGALKLHEVIDVEQADFDHGVDGSLLDWRALGPPEGAPLVRDGDINHIRLAWDGANFVEKRGTTGPRLPRRGPAYFYVFAATSVIIGAILVLRFLRRRRGAPPAQITG